GGHGPQELPLPGAGGKADDVRGERDRFRGEAQPGGGGHGGLEDALVPSAAALAGQQGDLRGEHGAAVAGDGAARAGDAGGAEGVRGGGAQGHRGHGDTVRGGEKGARAAGGEGERWEGGAGALTRRYRAERGRGAAG